VTAEPVERVVAFERLPWVLLAACVGTEVGLAILDAVFNFGSRAAVSSVQGLFNVAREDSLASWVGTSQTWLVGVTLVVIAAIERAAGATAGRTAGWLVLAASFCYMSADDGASIHERLGTASAELAEGSGAGALHGILERFPSYEWQVVVLPLFGLFGLFVLVFLWRELTSGTARALVVAAILCFVLAVGLDFMEGLAEDHPWNLLGQLAADAGPRTPHDAIRYEAGIETVGHLGRIAEEVLEMLANSLLWVAVVRHVTGRFSELRVRFE
jgi:hypothetical protein